MSGAIILAVLIVVVMPVAIIMTGALIAGALGWTIQSDAEARDDGTWTDLNT